MGAAIGFLTAPAKQSSDDKIIYNFLDPEHLGGRLPKRSAFQFSYPAELQKAVVDRWADYGYPTDVAETRANSLQQT